MNEKHKPDWPQTAEGVTDWEFVFENKENGFIPLILEASSILALKECTFLVIQQLFSRDNDSENIMKFFMLLNEIIPESQEQNTDKQSVLAMRTETQKLLRNIKNERIKHAKEYLKRKALNAPERRVNN